MLGDGVTIELKLQFVTFHDRTFIYTFQVTKVRYCSFQNCFMWHDTERKIIFDSCSYF